MKYKVSDLLNELHELCESDMFLDHDYDDFFEYDDIDDGGYDFMFEKASTKNKLKSMRKEIKSSRSYKAGKKMPVKAYDTATDTGAIAITGSISIVSKTIDLIYAAISFITDNISKLANFAKIGFKKIFAIPENIIASLRGDMLLNFNVNDLNSLCKNILPEMKDFIINVENITGGEGYRKNIIDSEKRDFKSATKSYNRVSGLKIKRTAVSISDDKKSLRYFNDNMKSIVYRGAKLSYGDAIIKIANDIIELKSKLKRLRLNLKSKMNVNKNDKDATKMKSVRNDIVKYSGKIVALYGDIMRAINQDIKTIMKKGGITETEKDTARSLT